MGAWGPAIFSNDTACDVRDSLNDALGEGISTDEAVQRVLDEFRESLEDADEADEIWIALAARLSALGRLTDAVRDRALDAIDSGRAVAIWEETPGGAKARGKALAKLRGDLTGPQNPPKKVRRRRPSEAPFDTGDLLRVAMPDGRGVLALVVDIFADNGGRYNALRLLREDDSSPFRLDEFLDDPIDREFRPVRRDFLMVGESGPEAVRLAQGVRPPEAGLRPPCRIETWEGGWRIDLPGTVVRWSVLPIWAAAFLEGRILEPPFPV